MTIGPVARSAARVVCALPLVVSLCLPNRMLELVTASSWLALGLIYTVEAWDHHLAHVFAGTALGLPLLQASKCLMESPADTWEHAVRGYPAHYFTAALILIGMITRTQNRMF